MAKIQTVKTEVDPKDFIAGISDEQTRKDCSELIKMMKAVTGKQPKMWGPSIIGFGTYSYTYASGHSGEAPLTAFSPRKQDLSLYIGARYAGKPLLKKLGKHKLSGGCLHVKRLTDVDTNVLKQIIKKGYGENCKKHSVKDKTKNK
jgi:hypothetical protein